MVRVLISLLPFPESLSLVGMRFILIALPAAPVHDMDNDILVDLDELVRETAG